MATIKHHDGHKTPPILTPGTLSPAILAQLIQYFNSYFNKCKIDNADKVKNILLSFQDIKIKNWINNNIEVLQGADYTFDTFTTELRKRFLDPHWEHSIVCTVVNSQMTSTESFSTFANRVMEGNNLLIGTTSRLDSTALRAKLEINMSGYLADKIVRLRPTDKQRILDIEIFEDWLAEITLLDEEITADLKRIADFASEHIAKKQRTENHYNLYPQHQQPPRNPHNPQAAFSPPLSGANTIAPSFNHTSTSNNSNSFRGGYRGSNNLHTTKRLCCPKLLPSEFELLEKHNGCRKCRRFYVNHGASDCPNEFPNPDTYTTLTEDMALKAMSSAAIASTYNAHLPSSSTMMNSVTPCPPKIAIPHTITPYRTPPIFSIFSMPQHIHTQPAFPSHSIIKVVLKGPFASIRHITYFHHLGLVHHRLSTLSFSPSPSIDTTLYFIENDPELISQKQNLHEGYDTA